MVTSDSYKQMCIQTETDYGLWLMTKSGTDYHSRQKLEQAIGDDIINQREVKEMYMNTK